MVTIEELEAATQKEELKELLSPISTDLFSQLEMLGQFAIAKVFVTQCNNTPSVCCLY